MICSELGLQLSKKLKTTRYCCNLYICMAYYFRTKKQYNEAIKMAQSAIDFGKRNKQYADTERAGYMLAVIYADRAYTSGSKQEQVVSIRQLFENISFSQKHQSFTQIANSYNLLFSTYRDNGNDSLAYLYLEKWLSYRKNPKEKNLRLTFLGNSLDLNLYRKRKAEAKTDLAQLLDFTPQKEEVGLYLFVLSEATKACIKFGEFEQAYSIIQKIQHNAQLMSEMDDERKMLFNCERTTIYLHKKNYRLAQQAHEQALFISKKKQLAFGDRLRLLLNQQKLFEHQKRFEEALVLNKRIHTMQDSLTSEQFSFELAASEERLEHENKERIFNQQLKIQQLENQRKTQQLSLSQYIMWATLLILAFLSVVVIIIALQMKQIKKQAAALKELNANKDRLFGIIGHDLRSPVIHLQVSLTTMLHKIPEKYTELTGIVSEQAARANRLLSTLDNLLYWSITQREKINVYPRTAPIQDFVEEALDWLEQSRLQTGVTVYTDIDPSHHIFVDDNHLRIILRNLLQNAYKFTPAGGQVRLSARAAEDTIELSIQDTGPGFKEVPKNDKKRGTQLGLKLVRELLAANHSTIQIESSSKGTLIRLSFPKA